MRYLLKKAISYNLQAIIGQRIKKRIVVFESDDWGGIRMPCPESFKRLVKAGLPIEKDPFNRYDSIASAADLSNLFQVLSKYRDSINNNPVITFNVTTGNPDFQSIKESDFNEYHFEPFFKTIERVQPGAIKSWHEGIDNNLIFPQYHGREHVHVYRWLKALQLKEDFITKAFNEEVFGIVPLKGKSQFYMAAYDYLDNEYLEYQEKSITEGLDIFKAFFGFMPSSFIPPCYICNNSISEILKNNGVSATQGKIFQLLPDIDSKNRRTYRNRYRFSGYYSKNQEAQIVRNVFFEPSENENFDWIGNALKRIEIAFKWQKPAVIITHRLNYIGVIDPKNRDRGLKSLEKLLNFIINSWPDVEFMSTQQLVEYYQRCRK